MGKYICSRAGFYLLLVSTLLFGQVTVCFCEGKFSEPETILTANNVADYDAAVDPYGNWHVVLLEKVSEDSPARSVQTVKYANSTNVLTIDQKVFYISGGEYIFSVSISVDTTGGIHIFETVFTYSEQQQKIYHFTVPKLLTLIPGINDHGQKMIDGSTTLVQQDSDATVRICEEQRDQE